MAAFGYTRVATFADMQAALACGGRACEAGKN
jgi:hypothetical protein